MNHLTNINRMYKVYEMLPSSNSSKQLILEPLTCVLKLSLLQWKENGTKISISNNSLKYNEPSLLQGLTRKVTGDSRLDLHNICHPLIKSLEWYPLNDPVHKLFYEQCINGLQKLKEAYDSNSIINHTIDHYIGILEGKEIDEELEDNAVTSGLRNMWLPREIEIAKTMIEHIMEVSDEIDREIYINILEYMLSSKEDKVNNYIHDISTSY